MMFSSYLLATANNLRNFLIRYLNSTHSTIKYDKPCYNADDNSCNFLDLKISISENKITTDLFRKDTDKPRALLPSSAHPNHIPNNIIYSMALEI